ncbi:DUF1826 domain-containing protein [Hoeflea prorocentri]|uniref:DUF1826 domain-containing protein n=1 Tax=Hoeflea prorocentri TaxID=1922333 RepID=A0A9X3UIS0_9HYPH|nr:DUF1826 domain-containing protein [Hoeflea prorocentri]MCY6379939.1 DUF1826 domain-containing protein [Hoeflea prorocentri]MDA5397739.1 DUF1826 domain-containing protein [Hoeflea prorocentri]
MSQLLSGHNHGHTISNRPVARQQTAQDVVIGRQAEILADITAPGVGAAIWQRNPHTSFQTWIDALAVEQLPNLRVTVPVELAEEAVRTACKIAKTPPGPEQKMLAGDVGALALIYGDVMKTDYVQIRLDVSDGAMCPKFHLDNVPARLLCTYRGPGTEYVPEIHRQEPERIRTMNTGSVGLFRGATWASGERSSLLHRSPGAQAASGPRLLLVIDAAA